VTRALPGLMRPPHLPFLPVVAPVLLAALLGATPGRAPAAPGAAGPAAARPAACAWPAWQAFQARLLQQDGRIIDPTSPRAHTVSEAQAYALFFALVADDRAAFERILRWTEDNLAAGDLALRLPAWQWGRRDDGSWGVLDANSAADADLWLAYVLAQAGRRWDERRYRALSSLLAERILREETVVIPGLGRSLLPGAQGFEPVGGLWRLNPSYAPPFLLRWFATHSGETRWDDVRRSGLRMLRDAAPKGFAPDWAYFRQPAMDGTGGGFALADRAAPDRAGGYDAIRVYLWVALTSAADPERAALLQQFSPIADSIDTRGVPPGRVDAASGAGDGSQGPPGFSAALLPITAALGRDGALHALLGRLDAEPPTAGAYYDQALSLFGRGSQEGRFAFAADGSLAFAAAPCPVEASGP
jgi:endoglucanase